MKIVEKMEAIHKFIKNNPDNPALANKLQELAVKAIYSGIKHDDWKKYMVNFASNTNQLQRLIGKDDDFNGTIYGPLSLAYVVANSTCGSGTDTETGRYMNVEMLEGLDRDLPSDEQIIEEFPEEQEEMRKYTN